jgi:hypothetical protein
MQIENQIFDLHKTPHNRPDQTQFIPLLNRSPKNPYLCFLTPKPITYPAFSMIRTITYSLLLLPLLLLFANCQKERFTTSPADKLAFSKDTLRFDTVFTQLGSATRILKIYNRHKQSIRISKIYLANGGNSKFTLNIDGTPGNSQQNLEIAPNDSMYVFAKVTINPNDPTSSSPFVLDEDLVFETNGNTQKVVLEAWGQNAVYLPSRYSAGGVAGYGCDGGEWVWDDPRPYVIYGILVIDKCTVRIPAGARIHVHGGLAKQVTDTSVVRYNDGFIAFTGSGKLLVEGTKDKPVIFEGDRLEPEFKDVSGQWTGIWLQSGTSGHKIDYCIVRNSIVGVRADSATGLTISNTKIYNTTSSGLVGVHANITASNCLFYNNTGFSIQLEFGGVYTFNFCTAASYGVDGAALRMTNVLCLDEACMNYELNPLHARFQNCIISGSRADQVSLYNRTTDPSQLDYNFKNCIVRVHDLLDPKDTPDFFDHCNPCKNATSQDTIFADPNNYNYHLDSLHSIAQKYAFPIGNLSTDLEGKQRDATHPDAGCYEIRR